MRERIPAFERMLWRACRGNVFLRQAEIETPLEDPSTVSDIFEKKIQIFYCCLQYNEYVLSYNFNYFYQYNINMP